MSDTRERIVTATTELFRGRGFNGTSLKQVIESAQAPTGSIYHFFPGGKEELGEAVIRESGAAYQQLFELVADEATDVAEAIRELFDGAADALEETDYIDICPIGNVAREVASTHEPLRQATVDVFAGWTTAISKRLRAAGFSPGDANAIANTVISAIEGALMLARARRSTTDLRATGVHIQHLVADSLSRGT